ncbi:MAG: hypothetical protein JKY94_01975 [Rhodobacteraceae bacterium]|nr:hypothetical protein [Paracoccaceae bacterium]
MAKGPLTHIQAKSALGEARCGGCERDVTVRANSGGHAYAYCNATDGGCGHSPQCRADASTVKMVRTIHTWRDGKRDMCKEIVDGAPKPEPTPAPKPAPVAKASPKKAPPTPDIDPNPEPVDEPEPEAADEPEEKMWWDE